MKTLNQQIKYISVHQQDYILRISLNNLLKVIAPCYMFLNAAFQDFQLVPFECLFSPFLLVCTNRFFNNLHCMLYNNALLA